MVVAVLVNRLAPSSRGLLRTKQEEAIEAGRREWATSDQYDGNEYRNLDVQDEDVVLADALKEEDDDGEEEAVDSKEPTKRKPFRAIALLTSFASDLDVISDWLFYRDTVQNDQQFRQENDTSPYLIPPIMLTLLFCVCLIGTCMWLILATDGRILTPLLKRLGVEKLSMGHMLFLSVVLEDVPQVVLTFLIEDYYEEQGGLSNFAVMNLTVSLYDTLIKLAEAYDERNDVVETGVWCKQSLWAHKDTITAVLALPLPPSTKDNPTKEQRPSLSKRASSRQRRTLIEKAMKPITPMEVPRLRFLTTSLDKSIRLWDTAVTRRGHRRENCIQKFSGHLDGVTCIALLGKSTGYDVVHPQHEDPDHRDEEHNHNTFFVTGCRNGNAKLWNLRGDFIRSFYLPSDKPNGIASIATVKSGSTFVCGHVDGTARLWEAWSGICVGEYRGHNQIVSAVCSLEKNALFLTGSHDETIKLWNATAAMKALSEYKPSKQLKTANASFSPSKRYLLTEIALHEEFVCNQSFRGHSGAILALACIEQGHAFVSGSADHTARLWSLRKKSCLRVFAEHSGPVRSIAVLDQVTFLSGGDDSTVKVWNALSRVSLRTYEGHTDQVTGISLCEDKSTFLTSSADCTVKVWVLTTIREEDESDDEDDLLDLNDLTCGRL
jgi:WD40 repeat protein